MKTRNKKQAAFAVFNFPYFKSDNALEHRVYYVIFAVRALFACVMAWSGMASFSVLLTDRLYTPAANTAVFACLVFFILLGLFRQLHVTLISVGVALAAGFAARDWIFEKFDALVKVVQHISGISSSYYSASRVTELYNDAFAFFTLFGILFGALCAYACIRRFNPVPVLAVMAVAVAPAFYTSNLHFNTTLLVFAASVIGFWVITGSVSANINLAAGTSAGLYASDKKHNAENRRMRLLRKIKSDMRYFGKYTFDGLTVFVTVIISAGLIASSFPKDGSLKYEYVKESIIQMFQNLGDWIYDTFDFALPGESEFDGYFSADGGNINISSNISTMNISRSRRPVAEITVDNTEKLYLRGDVGYEFNGREWNSISSLDYDSMFYDTENGRVNMTDVLNGYVPEIQYNMMMRKFIGEMVTDYQAVLSENTGIGVKTVDISYLQRINTLLMPGIPYALNFRESEYFNVKGDFVALADKGSVNSMKVDVLYQQDNIYDWLMLRLDSLNSMMTDEEEGRDLFWQDSFPVSYDEYTKYLSAYEQYVNDTYMSIPETEYKYIEDFVNEVADSSQDVKMLLISKERPHELLQVSIPIKDGMSLRDSAAEAICDYFTDSGKFKYSITAGNTFGEGSYLDNFLNKTRAGHCAMYASTMCLALRYLGVPARYVTGFTIGGDDGVKTADGYTYTIAPKDLHAWVEVYYDGLGWVAYDPTPAINGSEEVVGNIVTTDITASETPEFTTPDRTSTSEEETFTSTSDTTVSSTTDINDDNDNSEAGRRLIMIILITIGAVFFIFGVVLCIRGALNRLERKEKRLMNSFRKGEPVSSVREMLPFAIMLLNINGIKRRNGETPCDFAERADKTLGMKKGFSEIMPLFERAEFDNDPIFDKEEQTEVYKRVNALTYYTLEKYKGIKRLSLKIKLFGKVKLDNGRKNR